MRKSKKEEVEKSVNPHGVSQSSHITTEPQSLDVQCHLNSGRMEGNSADLFHPIRCPVLLLRRHLEIDCGTVQLER